MPEMIITFLVSLEVTCTRKASYTFDGPKVLVAYSTSAAEKSNLPNCCCPRIAEYAGVVDQRIDLGVIGEVEGLPIALTPAVMAFSRSSPGVMVD